MVFKKIPDFVKTAFGHEEKMDDNVEIAVFDDLLIDGAEPPVDEAGAFVPTADVSLSEAQTDITIDILRTVPFQAANGQGKERKFFLSLRASPPIPRFESKY